MQERARHVPIDVWRRRHRGILVLLWLHALGIFAVAMVSEQAAGHRLVDAAVVPVAALAAGLLVRYRRPSACIACFGLVASSALIVHLSGGYIEMHFHFFVMVATMALYQDWLPFLLALAFVVLHHGLVGVLEPASVYNHPGAWAHPWLWAGIHGAFVLAMSAVSLIAWRSAEASQDRLQLILDSAGDGILGVDSRQHVTFLNPAAARILGLDGHDAIGAPLAGLVGLPVSKPGKDADALVMDHARADGTAREAAQTVFVRSDGVSVPVEYVTAAVLERGTAVGSVVTFKDITERLRLEGQLVQSQKLESIGQLAAGVAHEINTPVQFVSDNVRFLQGAFENIARLRASYRDLRDTAATGVVSPELPAAVREAEDAMDIEYLMERLPLEPAEQVAA